MHIRNRLSGFDVSCGMRPRTTRPIGTGTNVTDSAAAAAIVYVFVKATRRS